MNDREMSTSMTVAPTAALGVLSSSEQQRAIAEVQASMILARSNPRDTIRCLDLIRQDCTRPTLAEKALYTYARGGTDVTGPSIRMAEAIAQRWGNLAYGTRELEQRDGESLMQAFAWDLETNVKREMIFTVPHVRESKSKGQVAVSGARDIYEVTANMGARRLRACLLGLIPGDVIEAAVEQVEETLKTKAAVTPERVQKMLELFYGYGVTKDQIEKRIQRRATVDTLTPALLLQLGKIANSLRDGMSEPGDWFEGAGTTTDKGVPENKVLLVSDVVRASNFEKWTQKQLLEFIREKFGKELTALEAGAECVAAVKAISEAAAAAKAKAAEPPPETVQPPTGEQASPDGKDPQVATAAAPPTDSSLFPPTSAADPKPSPAPGRRSR